MNNDFALLLANLQTSILRVVPPEIIRGADYVLTPHSAAVFVLKSYQC